MQGLPSFFERLQKPCPEPVLSSISQILNFGGMQNVEGSRNSIRHADVSLKNGLFLANRGHYQWTDVMTHLQMAADKEKQLKKERVLQTHAASLTCEFAQATAW